MTGWTLYWFVNGLLFTGMFMYLLHDSYGDMHYGIGCKLKGILNSILVTAIFSFFVSTILVGSLYWDAMVIALKLKLIGE